MTQEQFDTYAEQIGFNKVVMHNGRSAATVQELEWIRAIESGTSGAVVETSAPIDPLADLKVRAPELGIDPLPTTSRGLKNAIATAEEALKAAAPVVTPEPATPAVTPDPAAPVVDPAPATPEPAQ